MEMSDGSVYEGNFEDGKFEGAGIMQYPNGSTYEGMWKNNMQHGKGTVYNAKTDTTTEEEFREGKKWAWTKT